MKANLLHGQLSPSRWTNLLITSRYGEAMDITTPVGLDSPWMVTETGVSSPVVAVSGIRTWIRKTPAKPGAKPAGQRRRRGGLRSREEPGPAHPECRHRVWNPLCAPDRDRVCSVPVREAVRRKLDQAAERGHLRHWAYKRRRLW